MEEVREELLKYSYDGLKKHGEVVRGRTADLGRTIKKLLDDKILDQIDDVMQQVNFTTQPEFALLIYILDSMDDEVHKIATMLTRLREVAEAAAKFDRPDVAGRPNR